MTVQVVMDGRDMDRTLDRLCLEIIERNHGGGELAIVGIHTGGVFLAERLHRKICDYEDMDLPLGYLDITLYRDDWSLVSQNPIVRRTDLGFQVEEYRIVLVDDVIFTGRTVRAAMDAIMDYGRPLSIQLAVLVDRGGRELPIQPDYAGICVRASRHQRVDVLFKEHGGQDQVVLQSVER